MASRPKSTIPPHAALFNIFPAGLFPAASYHAALSGEDLELIASTNGSLRTLTSLDAVLCSDMVIHGIEHLLMPRSVQEDFNRSRSLVGILEHAGGRPTIAGLKLYLSAAVEWGEAADVEDNGNESPICIHRMVDGSAE
jgi:hypothetical protein